MLRDMENPKSHEAVEDFHLPEWETTSRQRGAKQAQNGPNPSVKERAIILFDRIMPKYRTYLGSSRRIACIIIIASSLILLALILGLAIGLGRKSRYDPNPTWNFGSVMSEYLPYSAIIKISLWARKVTQAISPTTALDLVPAVSPRPTPTTLSLSVTSPLTLYLKAQILTKIRCVDTN